MVKAVTELVKRYDVNYVDNGRGSSFNP